MGNCSDAGGAEGAHARGVTLELEIARSETSSKGRTAMPVTTTDLLTDDMLARFDERAPVYDRENRFFDEDWQELVQSGYLLATVPTELGGAGLGLDEYTKLQRRLAYVAPATALATNMHCYWTGLASDLLKGGDDSCRFILEKAAQGEVFCALHGEAGNDIPLLLAVASAARVDGGWEISGHKIFGSLTPVWTYGGFHAMDTSNPDAPQIVHGFFPRDTKGIQIIDTWDTLGMRATQSQDTVLDQAFVPDELVPLVCPAGFAGAGMFQVGIFAWALMGFAATYLGAAKRAFDITIETMPRRTSIALTNSMAHHPEVQHQVAEMRIAYDAAEALLERTCADWAEGVEHADWPVRLVATRHFVVNASYDIVDRALDVSGGGGAFKRNRLEQLFRDVRMGRFHPGNTMLAHELVGKLCLGINPDDPQRWG
jgi:alkylation response protein AidB-like acyl-CoA dehydrogenase